MIFDEVVEKTVEGTAGGLASLIMATDGISISRYLKPEAEMDLEVLGIEYANLLSEIKQASETMKAGGLKEVSLATDKYVTIMRLLTSEYFIALVMKPDGNQGKGRFLLRVNAPALIKEF